MFGAGGGTSSYQEVEETDLILLWGSNARETHPIFFHHLLKGLHHGARLFAVDPRRTSSAQWAEHWAALDVGSDIALANAMGREIIAAGLPHREFIANATEGFEAYRAAVEPCTLAWAERETGVSAEMIRTMAHAYARAERAKGEKAVRSQMEFIALSDDAAHTRRKKSRVRRFPIVELAPSPWK